MSSSFKIKTLADIKAEKAFEANDVGSQESPCEMPIPYDEEFDSLVSTQAELEAFIEEIGLFDDV